jgi:hypothetical protein
VPTIPSTTLFDVAAYHFTHLATPPASVAAQYDTSLLLVAGGLLLLLLVLVVLFWRMSRRPRSVPAAPTETPGESPAPIAVPPPPQPIVISLEFNAESGQHISFTLDKPALTIGRALDNDIVLAAPILNVDSASQHHARLRRDQEDYIVRDLNSKNGLAVNGRQTIENLLQDGDRLRFGEVEAVFRQSAGGAA